MIRYEMEIREGGDYINVDPDAFDDGEGALSRRDAFFCYAGHEGALHARIVQNGVITYTEHYKPNWS